MASLTVVVPLNANDLKEAYPRAVEALRTAADQLVQLSTTQNGNIPTPITKVDAFGSTVYSWTRA